MTVEIVPADVPLDTVARLAEIVNQAYAEGEKGLWLSGAARTSVEQLAGLVERGEIAAARRDGAVVGAVRVREPAVDLSELGMLAADPAERGSGIGRELVEFAERRARERGSRSMRLELLVPIEGEHPVKEFLRGWYTRRDYRETGAGDLAETHPDLAPLLAVPCRLVQFHKAL